MGKNILMTLIICIYIYIDDIIILNLQSLLKMSPTMWTVYVSYIPSRFQPKKPSVGTLMKGPFIVPEGIGRKGEMEKEMDMEMEMKIKMGMEKVGNEREVILMPL